MTTWTVPDWALTPLSFIVMATILLALAVGLVVIAFLLACGLNATLAAILRRARNTRLLLFAVWWKARGGQVPERIFNRALDEKLASPWFRKELHERLRVADGGGVEE